MTSNDIPLQRDRVPLSDKDMGRIIHRLLDTGEYDLAKIAKLTDHTIEQLQAYLDAFHDK